MESDSDDDLVLAELMNGVGVAGFTAGFWTPGKCERSVDGPERVTRFEGVVFARCE